MKDSELLPGRMMPDGADPCDAYLQLQARCADLESQLRVGRKINHVLVAEKAQQQERIAELVALMEEIRTDLRMRGTTDPDGTKVVNLSFSLWEKLNEEIRKPTPHPAESEGK